MNNYEQKYFKYKNKYLNLLSQVGGNKCPHIGYRQHIGECWHDSQSLLFSFSDVITERITSEPFIKVYLEQTTHFNDPIFIKELLFFIQESRTFILPINIEVNDIELFKDLSFEYIKGFINRLKHKINENNTQLEASERKVKVIKEFQERSEKVLTHKCVKNVYDRVNINLNICIDQIDKPKYDEIFLYNTEKSGGNGGIHIHDLINLQLFNYFFQTADKKFINFYKINNKLSNIKVFDKLTKDNIDNIYGITLTVSNKVNGGGHKLLLYKCNSKPYFYNDNKNTIIEYDWIKILKQIISYNDDTENFLHNLILHMKHFHGEFIGDYNIITSIECYYIDEFKDIDEYYLKQILCVNDSRIALTEYPISIFDCYNNEKLNNILNSSNYGKYKELILKILKQNGMALQYADGNLKNNEEIVSIAINQNGMALQYADDNLKKNEGIVSIAINQNGMALQYADDNLKKNEGIVLIAINQNGMALPYAGGNLQNNDKIVLIAINQNGMALQYVNTCLKEIVLKAVKQNGLALQYADTSLKGDIGIVLIAVNQNGLALQYADTSLKGDIKLVLTAIKQNSLALQYADTCLKNDINFIYNYIFNHNLIDIIDIIKVLPNEILLSPQIYEIIKKKLLEEQITKYKMGSNYYEFIGLFNPVVKNPNDAVLEL